MGEIVGYCETCGKQFRKYRSFHVCCSDKCRHIKTEKDNYGYVKKEDETKKCLHCKKEFITNLSNKKYCCEECYKAHQFIYHRKNVVSTRVCEVCEKEFETTHHAKKYCSDDCYKVAKKIREKVHV